MKNNLLVGLLILSGLGIVVFFGYRSIEKKTPPVNIYAPELSQGLLKEEFEAEAIASLLKASSGLIPPEVPFVNLRAELRYSPELTHMGLPFKYTRIIQTRLPDKLNVLKGQSGNNWASLRFRTSKRDTTCLYQGVGALNKSTACEKNGNSYMFRGCLDSAEFESLCKDPKICFAAASKWEFNELQARSSIQGQEFTMTLHGSDNCDTTIGSDEAITKTEQFPYCGDRISNKVTMTRDLNCEEHQGPALFIEGADAELIGNGHTIKTTYPVGIIVRGRNNKASNLTIEGPGQGYALLFENTEKIELENIKFKNWWVGIELFGSSIKPETKELSFEQVTKDQIRKLQ